MTETAKRLLLFIAALIAFGASAEREVSLKEYTADTRARLMKSVGEIFGDIDAEVRGVVTYAADGVFFLQEDSSGIKVLFEGQPPKVGTRLRVRGVPTLEGARIAFRAKMIEPAGAPGKLPEVIFPEAARLVSNDNDSCNWVRAQIRGQVIGLTSNGFAVQVEELPVNVIAETDFEFLSGCEYTHPTVEITGVLEQVLDPSSLLGDDVVLGIKLYVGDADRAELKPDALYLLRCREGAFHYVAIAVAALLLLALLLALYFVLRQHRRLLRSRAVAAERKRMADDLHDTIEQHLVGAKMLVSLGRSREAEEVLVRAKREIRDIVWGLKNDEMTRLKPADFLREFAKTENQKGLYRVEVKPGEALPGKLDASRMRDLALIVREAIGNAVKHGGAKHIAIAADPRDGGGWILRIGNDGAAFEPSAALGPAEGHFGLEGMRERARRLGGELSFARRKTGMVLVLEVKK